MTDRPSIVPIPKGEGWSPQAWDKIKKYGEIEEVSRA